MLKVHEPGEPRVRVSLQSSHRSCSLVSNIFSIEDTKVLAKKTHTKLRVSFNINGHQILFKACSNLVTTDACPLIIICIPLLTIYLHVSSYIS